MMMTMMVQSLAVQNVPLEDLAAQATTKPSKRKQPLFHTCKIHKLTLLKDKIY